MNLLAMLKGVAEGKGMLSNVTGLFVGENSKKRNIGFAGFAITAFLFQMDYIDTVMFDTMILACAGWTGLAFSSKLSKLGDALKDAKKGKKK